MILAQMLFRQHQTEQCVEETPGSPLCEKEQGEKKLNFVIMSEGEWSETRRSMFFELHKNLPREAPGSSQTTRKAIEIARARFQPGKEDLLHIVDIGCGPGGQVVH